jgi:FlaA1/EpsC-like NDP-sugar epimerase
MGESEVKKEEVKKETKKRKFLLDKKNHLILLADFVFIILAYVISLMVLCEVDSTLINAVYLTTLALVTPFYALGTNVIMFFLKLYVNDDTVDFLFERRRILIVSFITCIIYVIIMRYINKMDYPYAYYLIGGMLQLVFTSGVRFVYRFFFDKKGYSKGEE